MWYDASKPQITFSAKTFKNTSRHMTTMGFGYVQGKIITDKL